MLPNDVTGFNLFNQKLREFEFVHGPVFSDVLLADEINRATPRAQSALLEAMAERQVTVDNERHVLSPEFFVIATQNPIEHHGTYPLPEAQLDRFALKLSIVYPAPEDELRMLASAAAVDQDSPIDAMQPIFGPGELRQLQTLVRRLPIAPTLQRYLVDLTAVTRSEPQFAARPQPSRCAGLATVGAGTGVSGAAVVCDTLTISKPLPHRCWACTSAHRKV